MLNVRKLQELYEFSSCIWYRDKISIKARGIECYQNFVSGGQHLPKWVESYSQ